MEPLFVELTEKFAEKMFAKPFPRLLYLEAMETYGSDSQICALI